jgi:hypothetical protein
VDVLMRVLEVVVVSSSSTGVLVLILVVVVISVISAGLTDVEYMVPTQPRSLAAPHINAEYVVAPGQKAWMHSGYSEDRLKRAG